MGGVVPLLRETHRPLLLQDGGLPRLILEDALGLGSVLPGVHFPVGRTPLVPGKERRAELKCVFVCLSL